MLVSQEMRPYFRAASFLGVLLLAGDMLWSAKFGLTIGGDAMIIAAAISLASGILPVVGWYFLRAGHKGVATAIIYAWALAAFPFNVYSNMGVSTANRMGEVQAAQKVRTDYDAILTGKRELEGKLALLKKQQVEIPKQLKALTETKIGDWSVTTMPSSPEELDGQIKAKELEVLNESKRGGCKSKCEMRTNELAHLNQLRSKAQELKTLEDRIDKTMKAIETAKADLANADKGISATANQSSLYAKVVNWDLGGNPSDRSINVANEITGIATAFVLAVLAAITTLAGAYPALMKVGRITVNAREITVDGEDEAPEARHATTARKPMQDRQSQTERLARELADMLRQTGNDLKGAHA